MSKYVEEWYESAGLNGYTRLERARFYTAAYLHHNAKAALQFIGGILTLGLVFLAAYVWIVILAA